MGSFRRSCITRKLANEGSVWDIDAGGAFPCSAPWESSPLSTSLQGHLARGTQLRDWITRGMKLHSHHSPKLQFGQFCKDVPVVNLARARFMAAGDVCDMHNSQVRDAFLQLCDEIAGSNLLMVKIVEQPHLRVTDGLNNLECFGNLS